MAGMDPLERDVGEYLASVLHERDPRFVWTPVSADDEQDDDALPRDEEH